MHCYPTWCRKNISPFCRSRRSLDKVVSYFHFRRYVSEKAPNLFIAWKFGKHCKIRPLLNVWVSLQHCNLQLPEAALLWRSGLKYKPFFNCWPQFLKQGLYPPPPLPLNNPEKNWWCPITAAIPCFGQHVFPNYFSQFFFRLFSFSSIFWWFFCPIKWCISFLQFLSNFHLIFFNLLKLF